MSQFGQVFHRYAFRKSHYVVITGVHLHKSSRFLSDGPGIIGQVRLIGRPDLTNMTAAMLNNLRNTKLTADFDQFATGNNHFFSLYQRI